MKKTPGGKEPENAQLGGRSVTTDGRGPVDITSVPDIAQKGRQPINMTPIPEPVPATAAPVAANQPPVKIGDVTGGRDPVDMTPVPANPTERGRDGVPMVPVPKPTPPAPTPEKKP